jgi:hypothetical protein
VTTRQHKVHTQLGRFAVQIFAANDRMSQILIEHLDPTVWRAKTLAPLPTFLPQFTNPLVRTGSSQGRPSESQTPRYRSKLISRSDPLLSEARSKDSSYCRYE